MLSTTIASFTSPKICIVGGGIAGLTLARVLAQKNIHPIVLERDTSPTSRQQGGTLDLKRDSGQKALKIAGLHEEFLKLMRKEGQDAKVMMPNGQVMMHHIEKEDTDYNPEIDRVQLREIFLNVLGEHVKWGSYVKSITQHEGGNGYRVTLDDGSSHVYDLVIGADGCFSRVRPALTDVQLEYCGITFTETYISDAAVKQPAAYELVGRGMCVVPAVVGGGNGLIAQQNTDGKIRVYSVLQVPEDWHKTNGYPWEKDCPITRKLLLENYSSEAGWSDGITDLIRLSDDIFRPWPIYTLPVGFKWDHRPGITLIGDAAHVMSPFAGEGANISMMDGANLGQTIVDTVSSGGNLDEAIKRCEEDMFERAEAAAAESHANMLQFTGRVEAMDAEAAVRDWKAELESRAEGSKE